MRKFREVLNRALDTSCAQAKPSTFETHVPADLRHELGREALEAYRRDMLETLRLNIQDEFSKLCAERMVREKLDALDDILATMPASGDVRDPHPAPCPEGPMVAMLTTAAARKQQELEALEGLLAQVSRAGHRRYGVRSSNHPVVAPACVSDLPSPPATPF